MLKNIIFCADGTGDDPNRQDDDLDMSMTSGPSDCALQRTIDHLKSVGVQSKSTRTYPMTPNAAGIAHQPWKFSLWTASGNQWAPKNGHEHWVSSRLSH